MKKNNLLLFFLFCFLHASCKISTYPGGYDKTCPAHAASWNYLVYMAADNNLERFALENIADMQKIGSSDNVNILVLLDRSPGYDKSDGNWTGTKLFRITRSPACLNDDIIKDYGELDMTDPKTLLDFLVYADAEYHSERTALVLWSHGMGTYPDGVFQNIVLKPERSVIQDYTTGYSADDTMSIQELSAVLDSYTDGTGRKIDLLQFDACLMQMNEIIWQLVDFVSYIAGSQTDVPGRGGNYSAVTGWLVCNYDKDAAAFASFLCKSYADKYASLMFPVSYSVVRTGTFPLFESAFIKLIDEIALAPDVQTAEIKKIRSGQFVYQNYYPEYTDLISFLDQLEVLYPDSSSVSGALKNCIVDTENTGVYCGRLFGIGINFPQTETQLTLYGRDRNKRYPVLKFYNDTKWYKFIEKITACK
ncbi:MAG: clostripain-related cysteine peptidase [Treponema sp.]|nr:clostripain-related cysteine peptidase [Treponema sp.]